MASVILIVIIVGFCFCIRRKESIQKKASTIIILGLIGAICTAIWIMSLHTVCVEGYIVENLEEQQRICQSLEEQKMQLLKEGIVYNDTVAGKASQELEEELKSLSDELKQIDMKLIQEEEELRNLKWGVERTVPRAKFLLYFGK